MFNIIFLRNTVVLGLFSLSSTSFAANLIEPVNTSNSTLNENFVSTPTSENSISGNKKPISDLPFTSAFWLFGSATIGFTIVSNRRRF